MLYLHPRIYSNTEFSNEGFSGKNIKGRPEFMRMMGKIAYGRRRTEKKIGTRNEMHIVEQAEFPVYEGCHEAIISEAPLTNSWEEVMIAISIVRD